MSNIHVEKANERMRMLKLAIYEQDKLSSEISKRYETEEQFLLILDTLKEIKEFILDFLEKHPTLKEDYEGFKKFYNNPKKDFMLLEWFTHDNYGYHDEYVRCEDCGCIFKLPSSDYSYYKEGIIFEGEFDTVVCCKKCLDAFNKEDYINSKMNSPEEWVMMYSVEELVEMGWEKTNENIYEYGLYGVSHDPEMLLEKAKKEFKEKDYLFVRQDGNPYAQYFVLLMKDKEKMSEFKKEALTLKPEEAISYEINDEYTLSIIADEEGLNCELLFNTSGVDDLVYNVFVDKEHCNNIGKEIDYLIGRIKNED